MSDTSLKQLDESLSALVDGETSELELRRLLKASDEEFNALRTQWASHHMASASLKGDFPAVDYADLSLSISAAIADEPVLSLTENEAVKKSSIWSGFGRFAIAASVAGAVVVGVQFAPLDQGAQIADVDPVPSAAIDISGNFNQGIPSNTQVTTVSSDGGFASTTQERKPIAISESTRQQLKEAEEQVNRLMIEHAQNATQNTQKGVLSYERVPESK